jgi:hypothetical protein
MGMEIGRHELF